MIMIITIIIMDNNESHNDYHKDVHIYIYIYIYKPFGKQSKCLPEFEYQHFHRFLE